MTVLAIHFERLVNTGNYTNFTMSADGTVADFETPAEAMNKLTCFVNEAITNYQNQKETQK